jgi:dTDP-4-dehydrorhamnose 3,5-epimerase
MHSGAVQRTSSISCPPMEIIGCKLPDVKLIKPRVFGDERGFFSETYRRNVYEAGGIVGEFIQDNHSRSGKNIARGMHFQVGRGAAKLVRCGRGAIYDVVIDIRRGSPTYCQWEGFELSDENMHVLFCPVGFAHGFCTLTEVADVMYKQDGYYADATERGIKFDDPDVAIEWPIPADELKTSERDMNAPRLKDIADSLPFEYHG